MSDYLSSLSAKLDHKEQDEFWILGIFLLILLVGLLFS